MSSHNAEAAHAHSHEGGHEAGHGHNWYSYAYVLGALLFLTVVTVGAAQINFGSPVANVVIAMTIATFKAGMVAWFFMHLKDDKPINGLIFVSTLLFLAVFLGFCMIDADSRWDVRPSNYKGNIAKPALPSLDVEAPVVAPTPAAAPGAPGAHGAPAAHGAAAGHGAPAAHGAH
jgi:cytochrome c oxidase subunit IV